MYSTKRQAAFHHQLDYNIDDVRSTTRTRTTLHPQRGKLKSWIVRWEGTKAVSLPDQFCPINRSSYHFMTSNLSYDIPSSIRFARTTSENSSQNPREVARTTRWSVRKASTADSGGYAKPNDKSPSIPS